MPAVRGCAWDSAVGAPSAQCFGATRWPEIPDRTGIPRVAGATPRRRHHVHRRVEPRQRDVEPGYGFSFASALRTQGASTEAEAHTARRRSSGESCTDTTASAASPTTVEFSCSFAFTTEGAFTVIAEYTGSIVHAYSGSAPAPHTALNLDNVFADCFEAP